MSVPQIDAAERHTWRIEDCGCIFRITNGALIRGCRRHDPQVAGRIVAALEAEACHLWYLWTDWGRCHGPIVDECDDCLIWRQTIRTLLRIRRAGRT